MIHAFIGRSFESWRDKARELLQQDAVPEGVVWSDQTQSDLLPMFPHTAAPARESRTIRVPKGFPAVAKYAACFRDPLRWALLYRILWRLTHGEPNLLEISIDDDVQQFDEMHRNVRRDRHKMTAFVRFRRMETEGGEQYVAWYEPDHFIVPLAAPHFKDRFAAMRWKIFTPDDSVSWDGEQLAFAPGVPRDVSPRNVSSGGDELESLWKTYYATTFNPARIKLKAMRKEMPVRFWKNLPETQQIDGLLQEAPQRMEAMMKCQPKAVSAADYVPVARSLPQLREAVQSCKGCDLYCNATQAVFGEGAAHAKLMFIGEQPGDQEDLAGRPFVGPAGRLMDEVLEEIGLDRKLIYLTNAVKHFKFEQRGKRRMHATPNAREVNACRPWLEAEIEAIKPPMIVCLGATAAKSLMGNAFRITQSRGKVFNDQPWAPWLLATFHPSALLRAPDPELSRRMRADFTADLRSTMVALNGLA